MIGAAVPDEPDDSERPFTGDIKRQDRDQPAVGLPTGRGERLASLAEVTPPDRVPLPGREDVARRLGKRCPFVSQLLEVRNQLQPKLGSPCRSRSRRGSNPLEILGSQLLVRGEPDDTRSKRARQREAF